MARPTKAPNEKRTEQVKIRLTLAEYLHLADQADMADLSLAEYVRRRALGYRIQPPASRADQQLLAEINRIGVNINQLARHANSGQEFESKFELMEDEIARLLVTVSEAYDR